MNWTQPGAARGQKRNIRPDGQRVYLSVNNWNEDLRGAGGVAVVNLATGKKIKKSTKQPAGQVEETVSWKVLIPKIDPWRSPRWASS